MKIYLASRFSYGSKMRAYRHDLEHTYGHEVTSRWIDFDKRPTKKEWEVYAEIIATNDLEDIKACDLIIVDASEQSTRGGYHTELGLAVALGKRAIVITPNGPDVNNVFFYLPEVEVVDGWDKIGPMVGFAKLRT